MTWSANKDRRKYALAIHLLLLFSLQGLGQLPVLKSAEWGKSRVRPDNFFLRTSSPELLPEADYLEEALIQKGFTKVDEGFRLELHLADPGMPQLASDYWEGIREQAYRITIEARGARVEALSRAGVFYGVLTLLQLMDPKGGLPEGIFLDWPDLDRRMIMSDPARQHENMDYYMRLIRFCGEHRINALQIHLTDHQTSVLFHEDYQPLMHAHAWKKEDIRELVSYAGAYHVELIPEIESFGHSRMFIRMPDATDYLHQTEMMETEGWTIIDIPGYTSVLCPSSDKALRYLDEMYGRAVPFNSPVIHLGFDEVDMSVCERCKRKLGNPGQSELFRHHLKQCMDLAAGHYEKVGIWGDMIVHDPSILEGLSPERITIYDWNYSPEVNPASMRMFREKGFEVIACPALMSWPYILAPSADRLRNVRNSHSLAREYDLAGVNTTIWVPQRYLSDVLWPSIAYAAGQSWYGSSWDEGLFYEGFFREYFGSDQGEPFADIWRRLLGNIKGQGVFQAACWKAEEDLARATDLFKEREDELRASRDTLEAVIADLALLGEDVSKHREEWQSLESAARIQAYLLDRLLAAARVKTDKGWDRDLIATLDATCVELRTAIEKDWDRNRFSDDVNKEGIYQEGEHLLHQFTLMHRFHREIQ